MVASTPPAAHRHAAVGNPNRLVHDRAYLVDRFCRALLGLAAAEVQAEAGQNVRDRWLRPLLRPGLQPTTTILSHRFFAIPMSSNELQRPKANTILS